MKQVFIHNPFFRILCPPVYGLIIYLLVLLVFDSISQVTQNFFSQEVLLCIVLTYLLSESLRLMIIGVNRFFPVQKSARTHVLLQTGLNMLCTILVISGGVVIYFVYIVGYTVFRIELITFNSLYLLTCLFYSMLYISIYYLQQHSSEKLAQETALRKKMEYQLQQLKNDVNPELLYNSLETLTSLVHQDATTAEDFIDRLAAIYRYSLDHRHKELIPLCNEVSAIQHLVYVYNVKHAGCIRIQTTLANEEDVLLLIPGSLLDVVEEAIISTIVGEKHPLEIDIFVENQFLVIHYVCNDRLVPRQVRKSTYEQLVHSYGFFTDRKVVYVKTDEECLIKMPLLEAHTEKTVPLGATFSSAK